MGKSSAQRKSPPQRAVSRILFCRRSPCGELQRDDHSSSPVIADGIERPTRRLRTGRPSASPYLALLRAGFSLPPVLPRARCALTAPFHPYPSTRPFGAPSGQACLERVSERRVERRYVFCATFLRVAPTGRYPAHCPAEFGLSSRLRAFRRFGVAIVWPAAADVPNRQCPA